MVSGIKATLDNLLAQPVDLVAPQLLGCHLRHASEDGVVVVRLTEVEAYAGQSDPASHAFRGRTTRNATMFGVAGNLYVYRSHGLHWCCNVVTGPDGTPSGVLLRAGEVVDGVALAQSRRGKGKECAFLARGPACLAKALGLTGDDDGVNLITSDRLRLDPPVVRTRHNTLSGPRVGVSKAPDVAWRFWLASEPSVSKYKRSRRASS